MCSLPNAVTQYCTAAQTDDVDYLDRHVFEMCTHPFPSSPFMRLAAYLTALHASRKQCLPGR